jgi:hypothetical protein
MSEKIVPVAKVLSTFLESVEEEKKMTPQQYAAFRKQRDAGKVDPTRKKSLEDYPPSRIGPKGELLPQTEEDNVETEFVVQSTVNGQTVRDQRFKDWDKAFAYLGDKILSLPVGGKMSLHGFLDEDFVDIVVTKQKEEDVA